jgi:hypothetical protein
MSCPCDQIEYPPRQFIPAGLTRIPRQIATFPEFRAALLREIGQHSALRDWRGRQSDDFGVMLLEMWAYVSDVTSFYDEVLAHEQYVRTARQRSNLRKVIGLLGYIPRPAVGASVDLAALADGRKAVTLPKGTAFRSGAFAGNPPQVFELTADAIIHPLSNEWKILPVRPSTFGSTALSLTTLLCEPGSVSAKQDDLVLVKVGSTRYVRTVSSVANQPGADGETYAGVTLSSAVPIPANTPVSSIKLLKSGTTAQVWSTTSGGFGPRYLDEESPSPFATRFDLSSLIPTLRVGQDVIVSGYGDDLGGEITKASPASKEVTAATTIEIKDGSDVVTSKIPVDAVYQRVTEIWVEPPLPGVILQSTSTDDAAAIAIYYNFATAGRVTIEGLTTLAPNDLFAIQAPVEMPSDADVPAKFQLEDKNGDGAAVGASLVYPTGVLNLNQGTTWASTGLVTPVHAFGNIVSATRGESVNGEALGTGDATVTNQSFTLKKGPLTYLSSPTTDNTSGVASTLSIYVDGVLWTEVASFYGQPSNAQVYIVRQNDGEKSIVTFGDGVRGCRLVTGAAVTAYYRFGAGAVMPPAASINQIAKPVKGLRGIRNPVAATGGADSEPIDELRKYAPRSALLLGRAVSLADLEAAAAAVGGVRATRAEWRWNQDRLRPGAQIYYFGDSGLDDTITQKLAGISEEDLPIDVVPATGLVKTLSIQIEIDSRYLEADVVAAVRTALMDPNTGLLAPERIGIGLPLFRSRIYEFVLRTPGAASVTAILLDCAELADWGITPGAGNYFDFENGTLLLNGT